MEQAVATTPTPAKVIVGDGVRTLMIWSDLEAAAPDIARLGKERFDRAGVALLGTRT
jgi:hypothetical protein